MSNNFAFNFFVLYGVMGDNKGAKVKAHVYGHIRCAFDQPESSDSAVFRPILIGNLQKGVLDSILLDCLRSVV